MPPPTHPAFCAHFSQKQTRKTWKTPHSNCFWLSFRDKQVHCKFPHFCNTAFVKAHWGCAAKHAAAWWRVWLAAGSRRAVGDSQLGHFGWRESLLRYVFYQSNATPWSVLCTWRSISNTSTTVLNWPPCWFPTGHFYWKLCLSRLLWIDLSDDV